jgi:hypothetical protein
MTRLEALQRLAVATGRVLDSESRSLYLERLTPFSEAAVAAGCRALETTATFWPKLAEVVESVQNAAHSVVLETDPRTWVKCPSCEDTGWMFETCLGGAKKTCGRPDVDGYWTNGRYTAVCKRGHTFVTRCTHVMQRDSLSYEARAVKAAQATGQG